MTGNVIPLFADDRPAQRRCSDCTNGAGHVAGVHCLVFGQTMFDERVATTCDAYQDHNKAKENPVPEIPAFENEEVIATKAKIPAVNNIDVNDLVWRMDETVRFVVSATVAGISHAPNNQGRLERVQTVKVNDVVVIPMDLDMDMLREALSQ